jgi:hypothetical protein
MAHPLRAVLVLVALLLLLNLDHGLPHRYVPDDTTVRCALGMARDLTSGEVPLLEAVAPPDGRYTTYPMLLPYLDLAALGARFGVGLVLGEWSGPGSFKAAIFEDPGLAWLPARLVSVLLGLLLPLGLYRAARELKRSKGEAALAALVGGTSLLFVQYAHTSRPWAAMLGLAALTTWLSLRLVRRHRPRDVGAAFASGALCGASFQVGLPFVLMPLGGWVLSLLAAGEEPRGVRVRRGLMGLGLSAVLLLGLGYPHLLLHGGSQGADQGGRAAFDAADAEVAVGGQNFSLSAFDGSLAAEVGRSWLGSDPLLALAGLLGLLALGVSAASPRTWLLVVLPGLGLVAVFTLYDGTHVRYLMSATPFLGLGAGWVLARLARGGTVTRALALVLLAVPLVQAARLDLLLGREDTRTLAAAKLPELLDGSRRIALDGMGSRYGPPLQPAPETLKEVAAAGVWLGRMEREAVGFHEAGLPSPDHARQVLPIQRFWRYDSYYATDFLYDGLSVEQHRERGQDTAADGRAIVPVELRDWIEGWRVDAYVQVDRIPDEARRAPLTELLAARGSLLWEVSPTGKTAPAAAQLPTDMAFPLIDLWTYERPGPWIRVWDLSEDER